jgi:hypothetical protein
VDRASVAQPKGRRGRRARTNRGRFGSLELRYFRGDLSPSEEESFEAICYQMHRLYLAVRS